MKVGLSIVAEVTLYSVSLPVEGCVDNLPTDSYPVDSYFENEKDAILASAICGYNDHPKTIEAFKLSDGTYIGVYQSIKISCPPNDVDIANIKEVIQKERNGRKIKPAEKILFENAWD